MFTQLLKLSLPSWNNNPFNLTTPRRIMQETVTLTDLLKELKEIKDKIERIEEMIEDLIDSTLTPEEEELIKKHKEMIKKGDFSEFIDAEDLCIE